MSDRVLVTGAAGYIGSLLCTELVGYQFDVVGIDNFMYNQINTLNHLLSVPNFEFCHADVTNRSDLTNILGIVKPKVIIPLAALVGQPICDKHHQLAVETNFEQIKTLVDWAEKKTAIIYPNTNSGYGQCDGLCTEETPMNPISHYGRTKCAAEEYIRDHCQEYVILRLATVFGLSPRMRTDLLVNDLTWQAYRRGRLEVFQPNYKRNFVHIDDVVAAMVRFTEFAIHKEGRNGIYNLGLDEANMTKGELAKMICNIIGAKYSEKEGADPDQRDYNVSSAKIKSVYVPHHSLKEGIQQLTKYYASINNTNSVRFEKEIELMRNDFSKNTI